MPAKKSEDVIKAAKIAAILLIGVGITAMAKYFVPKPDELPLQQSISLLQNRKPDKEITTLANATVVRYADIAGYAPYDSLRRIAVEKLETVAEATGDDKFKRNYAPWEKQEEIWGEIGLTVEKIESIAKDQLEYNARRNLDVADDLTRLKPSSEIVSQARDKAEQAAIWPILLCPCPVWENSIRQTPDTWPVSSLPDGWRNYRLWSGAPWLL